MARIRTIKPAFFTSDQVCACSPLARLLFIGLWCEADRDGRLYDKPNQLKFRILPADECSVDSLLWELAEHGLVERFASDGGDYIQIPKFGDHQRPHPKEPESAIRASGERKPCKKTASRDRVVMLPGDFPASSAIKGREGDLGREGDQEGKGTMTGTEPVRVVGAPALLMSSAEYDRLRKSHRFVSQRLRVPNVLHTELVAKLGGESPDAVLCEWYAELSDGLDASKEPVVDVFQWLRPRFVAWASEQQEAATWAAMEREARELDAADAAREAARREARRG